VAFAITTLPAASTSASTRTSPSIFDCLALWRIHGTRGGNQFGLNHSLSRGAWPATTAGGAGGCPCVETVGTKSPPGVPTAGLAALATSMSGTDPSLVFLDRLSTVGATIFKSRAFAAAETIGLVASHPPGQAALHLHCWLDGERWTSQRALRWERFLWQRSRRSDSWGRWRRLLRGRLWVRRGCWPDWLTLGPLVWSAGWQRQLDNGGGTELRWCRRTAPPRDEKYSRSPMIKGVFPRDSLTEGSDVVSDGENLPKISCKRTAFEQEPR